MAGEDARLKAGLKAAEDELNLIKNQIQQTLLDIREHILDVTNPFNSVDAGLLDDDEEIIEEGGLGGSGGGGGDSDSLDDGGSVDAGDEAADSLEGEGEDEPVDEDSLLEGDDEDFEEEFDDMPEDDLLSGGGDSGGLSELLEPEDELEDEIEEDFELDEEPEDEEELEEDDDSLLEDEDETSQDPDMRDGQTGDGVGSAIAAALSANVDLLTLASLVRWTAVTRDRLGPNRLDILLDAYELAGRISPQMKNVIKTISALGDEEGDGSIPVRDVVTAMVRMEAVMNVGQARESNRLLGLLIEMDDDPLDRLIA